MQLGAFMRLNVKVMASRRTTIREEMELLNAYLDIIKSGLRISSRLNASWIRCLASL